MKFFRPLFVLLLLAAVIISCGESRQNPRDLSDSLKKTDQVIWNATFQDLEGNEVSIQDFEGKVVLIDFWETWCSPCLEVFPAMDSLRKEYGDDFEVLAINLQGSDTPEDVQEFMEKEGYDFHFLLDTNDVGSQVITFGIPYKVFIDPEGYLISAEVGTSGREGDYRKAKEVIEQYRES